MKRSIAAVTASAMVLSCSTSHKQETTASVLLAPIENVNYFDPLPSEGRAPSAKQGYFVQEIEHGFKTEAVAWSPVLSAGVRLDQIFEFARHNPHNFFAELRKDHPIYFSPGGSGEIPGKGHVDIPNVYVVTQYNDVAEVLAAHDVFAVEPYTKIMDSTLDGEFMLGHETHPANLEKPGMHAALNAKANAAKIRAIVKSLAQRAINAGAKGGKIDIVKSVARAVPLGLNDEYFGFNGPTPEDMARWSRATQYAFFHNPKRDEKIDEASRQAGREMREYLNKVLLPERTKEIQNGRPANDVISQIIRGHDKLGIKSDRIIYNVIGLLVGSVETTEAAVTQSLQYIMNNPRVLAMAQRAAAAQDDDAMSRIVWEALRFDAVNPWVARIAQSQKIIGAASGHPTTIPKGALVLASTESAMFDKSAFPDPGTFDPKRNPDLYLHLGFLYHRCLGDDVAKIMVPEIVKQILLIDGLRADGNSYIDRGGKDGPFPESYILGLNQDRITSPNDRSLSENVQASVQTAMDYLGLGVFIGQRIDQMQRKTEALIAIKNALNPQSVEARRKAIEDLPDLEANAMKDFTFDQKVAACLDTNPKSKEVFPNLVDRTNYCKVDFRFRGCYFTQRLINKQSSFAAYYYCVYNRQYLPKDQIPLFKSNFSKLDMFYFLGLE